MTSITFRGGRQAPHAEDTHPRLKLGRFLTGTYPAAPAVVDYVSKVTDWPMYGNDQWGDCVWAMIGDTIEAATTYGHTNPDEVDAALYLFGHVQLGINFPAVAMDQFNASEPWDVVPDDGGNEGGHAISGGLAHTAADTPLPPRPSSPAGTPAGTTWSSPGARRRR